MAFRQPSAGRTEAGARTWREPGEAVARCLLPGAAQRRGPIPTLRDSLTAQNTVGQGFLGSIRISLPTRRSFKRSHRAAAASTEGDDRNPVASCRIPASECRQHRRSRRAPSQEVPHRGRAPRSSSPELSETLPSAPRGHHGAAGGARKEEACGHEGGAEGDLGGNVKTPALTRGSTRRGISRTRWRRGALGTPSPAAIVYACLVTST
jgi:hypothetical protein